MAGSYTLGADLARDHQKLIELEMIVAEAAGDGSAPGKILFHERADNLALETLLMIDYVIRNADVLGDAAGVVDIVERAAASLHGLRHAFVTGEASLVPELHGQAMMVCPSARSMAATVEESTPPDIATAMVCGVGMVK